MRRFAILAVIGLSIGAAAIFVLGESEQSDRAQIGEGTSTQTSTDSRAFAPDYAPVVPPTQDSSAAEATDSSSFDFGSIGLPDVSRFELAPGVESTLREWSEAGCISPETVRIDSLDAATRHRADEWLIEEGDVGGLEFDAIGVAPETFDDYGSYSTETLERLADGTDDPKAVLALALRLHRQGALSDAKERYEQAIVLGYTKPLMPMPLLRFRLLTENSDSDASDAAAQWEYEIERLTSDLIREQRGAPFPLTDRLLLYIRAQRNGLSSDHSWEETWHEARVRAQNRYAQYSQRRRDEGLGPFDNSRPSIATRLDRFAHLYTLGRESNLDLCRE